MGGAEHFSAVDGLYLQFSDEVEGLLAAVGRTRTQIERIYQVGRPPGELAVALHTASDLWIALGETYSKWATALEAAFPERAAA